MPKNKKQSGNVAKSIETVRINRKLERFLTINGADPNEKKNILPFSSVVIPEEVFRRYDLAEKDLATLAPGHCYSYKKGLLDKVNATEWDDGLGAFVAAPKRVRKQTIFLSAEGPQKKKTKDVDPDGAEGPKKKKAKDVDPDGAEGRPERNKNTPETNQDKTSKEGKGKGKGKGKSKCKHGKQEKEEDEQEQDSEEDEQEGECGDCHEGQKPKKKCMNSASSQMNNMNTMLQRMYESQFQWSGMGTPMRRQTPHANYNNSPFHSPPEFRNPYFDFALATMALHPKH